MDTTPLGEFKNSWAVSLFSKTLLTFYLSLVAVMIGVMYLLA